MSRKEFYIDTEKYLEYDDELIFIDKNNRLARLRKRNRYNNWDPNGTYPPSGFVVFENFRADCLTELYSFEDCVMQSGTSVDYQLSPDNGQNYYYFSGSAWTLSSGINDFSSSEIIDANIANFPLSYPKQIRLKARLKSFSSGTKTPQLMAAFINYEHSEDQLEDLDRTLYRIFNQYVAVKRKDRFAVSSGVSGYSIPIIESGSLVHVERVVNLSGNLGYNLLQSFSSGTNTAVILPQISGTIEIDHYQKYPVFLGGKPDEDEFESIKSAFIIRKLDSEFIDEMIDGRELVYISRNRMQARLRPHPEYRMIEYEVISEGKHHLECVRMNTALVSLFKRMKKFSSNCTGNEYNIDFFDSIRSVNDVIPFISSKLQVRGFFDINIREKEYIGSGIPLYGDNEYIGSGTIYEEVPLIKPSGVEFNTRILGDC